MPPLLRRLTRVVRIALRREPPAEASERRLASVLGGTLAGIGARAFTSLVSLVSLPLCVRYLGQERYGAWATLWSLLAWLTLADVALGSHLSNELGAAHGRDDVLSARKAVSVTFFLLAAAAATLLAIGAVALPHVGWPAFFNVQSDEAAGQVGPAVLVAFTLGCLALPMTVADRIYNAQQRGVITQVWTVLGSAASLVGLLAATRRPGGLPWLFGAVVGPTLLVKIASNAWLFLRNRTALRPTLNDLSCEAIRRALSQGGLFFLTQVVALVLYNTDNVVIARVLGARSVTHYAVTRNLFAYANIVVGLAYPHLWAAHSEAIARGDGVWAARTLWRSLQASFAVNALLVLPLILFGREIIRLWAGPDAVPPQALIGWMGAWSLILGPSTCLTSFLNASGKLGVQIVSGLLLFSPANILLSIAWAGRFGTPGVIAATVATHLAFWLAPCLVVAHRTARSLQTAVPSGQVA